MIAALTTAALPAAAVECPVGEQPAATLLFPYFEVDLDGGRTTLLAIANTQGHVRLVRVVLWTDWALPTLVFDLYLPGHGVQTINLRDVFAAARGPRSSRGASSYPGCPAELSGEHTGWTPGLLQAAHTGREVPGDGCYAEPRADPTLATGYVTVDVTQACPAPASSRRNVPTPISRSYFSGPARLADDRNEIVGDWFLVDPGQDFAGGQSAAHIVADPDVLPGDYTFYGRYVLFDGSDHRLPLATAWRTRYLVGGGFDGGTDLVVWRDTRDAPLNPYHCGLSGPPWRPLREQAIEIWNEDAESTVRSDTEYFDLATQKVPVASLALPHPFGRLNLVLQHGDGTRAQAWVGWDARAEHRYNVSLAAAPIFCEHRP